jgi:hypothetical protein
MPLDGRTVLKSLVAGGRFNGREYETLRHAPGVVFCAESNGRHRSTTSTSNKAGFLFRGSITEFFMARHILEAAGLGT